MTTLPEPLVSTDDDSPIRRIRYIDEDWAIVTVRASDGDEINYKVRRHSVAEQFALNR